MLGIVLDIFMEEEFLLGLHLNVVGKVDIQIYLSIIVGTAFDVAQNLSYSGRLAMRNLAASSGIWNYVEPISATPTWVHFDERTTVAGYPILRFGSKGNYVCTAQDALNTLGYSTGGLDGIFGSNTRNAVLTFQSRNRLSADGILGPLTWSRLMAQVNGIGQTETVIN